MPSAKRIPFKIAQTVDLKILIRCNTWNHIFFRFRILRKWCFSKISRILRKYHGFCENITDLCENPSSEHIYRCERVVIRGFYSYYKLSQRIWFSQNILRKWNAFCEKGWFPDFAKKLILCLEQKRSVCDEVVREPGSWSGKPLKLTDALHCTQDLWWCKITRIPIIIFRLGQGDAWATGHHQCYF